MTKITFNLERFKEFLEEIKSSDEYSVDMTNLPIVIVCCTHNYFFPGGKTYGSTTVSLTGRIEE